MRMGSWTLRLVALTGCIASLPLLPVWGAEGPAHLVADLDPGTAVFDPSALPRLGSYTAVAGRVVFFSFLPEGDPGSGHTQCALWETDGSGVERLADLCGGTAELDRSFFQLRVLATTGSVAFFTDPTGALWRTDATAAGTFPLGGGLLPAPPNNGITPHDAVLGPDGRTLFYAACTAGEGCEPWASDGTRAGTRRIPLAPGPDGPEPAAFKVGGGRVLFTAGDTLWSSDGTVAGTRKLLEAAGPLQEDFLPLGNALYFIFNAGGVDTVSVLDLRSGVATNLGVFPAAGLHLTTGVGLHAAGGRVLFGVISPQLTVAGDQLFFRADDGVHGTEIWKTDGTPEGTVLVKDVNLGPDGSLAGSLTAAGDLLYFAASDGEHGVELWRSDGTEAGTTLVQDLFPGPAPSNPEQLTASEGNLFFTADDGIHGRELWALPLPLPPH